MSTSFATRNQGISVPGCTTGKRSRSNSSSMSSSPSGSSTSGSSIFSRHHSVDSEDSSSSCSSPSSSKTSPASSCSDEERPCKSVRTSKVSIGPVGHSHLSAEEVALSTLKSKCSLQQVSATVQAESQNATPSPPDNAAAGAGVKTLFVDCLVDATVHVLDMIWHAPVQKSIAFLQNVRSASSICTGEITRPCRCPVGAPFTGGIPLDLFIRETLRRSRTSCSTLQAALLYCKRVGAEAIRKRAEKECVELTDEEKGILEGQSRAYPSLQRAFDKDSELDLPPSILADPILCSRRTFLAAVMTSSKFLQDRTFSNRAWSKISGLSVNELGLVERRMLDAIEFDLYVGDEEWQSWTNYLKGDWKAGIDTCQCHSPPSEMLPATIEAAPRKTLERTSSLRVEEVADMESTPSTMITTPQRHASPPTFSSDSNASTPRQALPCEDVHRTPTKAVAHKRESSLLPFALSNSVAIGAQQRGNTIEVEVPMPFPIRKGLTSRSLSTQ